MYFLGFLIRKLMKHLSKVKEFKIYPINSYSYIICFWWCCSKSTKQRLNYQNFICWILIFDVLIWWWDIRIDYHILFLIGKNFDYRNIKSVSDSFRRSSFSSDLIHLFWLIKKKKKITLSNSSQFNALITTTENLLIFKYLTGLESSISISIRILRVDSVRFWFEHNSDHA